MSTHTNCFPTLSTPYPPRGLRRSISNARPSSHYHLLFSHNTSLGADCSGIIAAGADASSRIAVGHGSTLALSYNHGHLADDRSLLRFDDTLRLVSRHFPPTTVVADSHPGLASSRVARALAKRVDAPLVAVDHAHAHAAAVMAEHDLHGEVVAIVLDSGTVSDIADSHRMRGSELLVCSRPQCEVVAHDDFIAVPRDGEPWEDAVGLILHYTGSLRWIPDGLFSAVGHTSVVEAARRCTDPSESVLVAGGHQLWNAVAAMIGTEQGDACGSLMDYSYLERLAAGMVASPYSIDTRNPLSAEEALEEILADLHNHTDPRVIAARFHALRARQWAVAAARLCSARGLDRVVVTGDLLDNHLLALLFRMQLGALGLKAYLPAATLGGDASLAVGQAAVAASLRA